MKTARNRKTTPIRLLACILCACLMFSLLTACQPQDPTLGSSFPTTLPRPTDKPTEPTSPAPTETDPTQPKPTEPAPTESAPTEPAPTEPAPTEPAPTEPAPTDPAPTEPAPTEPAPTEPPAPDYSWLVGTWTSVQRHDYEDGIATLGLLSITLNADGNGYLADNSYTNFDIINGSFVDHWIQPGDLAFTSEDISYQVEGNKLAITFRYHEFVAYEPFTVYFPLPELHNGMITLTEPEGNIQDSAMGGSIPGNTFVKEPISLEDLCTILGVDYTVPPVGGGDHDTIPQWLIGSWETAWRDDANNDGQPYLITSGYVFLEDGTGYTLGHEYWAWDMENGCPGNAWESVPMGYPSTSFIYSVSGDQLTISYTGDDFEEYQPPYPTDVMTLIHNADGSITLTPDGRTYVHNSVSPEQLCAMLGVDYSLPPLESSIPIDRLVGSWEYIKREYHDRGISVLRSQYYKFNKDGTGYFYYDREWSNLTANGSMTYEWVYHTKTPSSRSFTYSIRGDRLYINYTGNDAGLSETFYIYMRGSEYLNLTDVNTDVKLEYAKVYSNTSLKKLCELLYVPYELPRRVTSTLNDTWQVVWREDSLDGSSTLYHVSIRFNNDGTGEYSKKAYLSGDGWQEVAALYQYGTFSYQLKGYYLTIADINADVELYESIYTVYQQEDGFIFFYAPEAEPSHEYVMLYDVDENATLEQLCNICRVDYTLP